QQDPERRELQPGQNEYEIAGNAMKADRNGRLGTDQQQSANDDQRTDRARRGDLLSEPKAGEKQPTERCAGWLDHAAMPKRDQQEPGVTDEDETRSAQNGQQDRTTPADAVEIAHAAANDQRQECHPGPEVAMNCQIERRKSDSQAVTDTGKSGRPEEGCPNSADNADGR